MRFGSRLLGATSSPLAKVLEISHRGKLGGAAMGLDLGLVPWLLARLVWAGMVVMYVGSLGLHLHADSVARNREWGQPKAPYLPNYYYYYYYYSLLNRERNRVQNRARYSHKSISNKK